MKELQELVSIVKIRDSSALEVLTNQSKKGKTFELFEAVKKGKFKTDEEAIVGIYGDVDNSAAYRKLKDRLAKQLLNTVLFSETSSGANEEREQQIATSYRWFSTFMLMIGKGAFNSAYSLGKRIVKQTMRLEATELTYMVSHRMRTIVQRIGDEKKFNHYNKLVYKYQKLHQAEVLAAEYSERITIHFRKSRSAKTELAEKAKEYSRELKKYTDELDSAFLYFHAYNIYVLSYEIAGEMEKVLESCMEVVSYFEKRKQKRTTIIFFFLFKTVNVYVKRKQYVEGEKTIIKTLSNILNPNSRNYFLTIEQYILLAFHCEKYEKAQELYYAGIKTAGFELLMDVYKEHWKLFEPYIEFLKLNGKLLIGDNQQKNKFRLGRFLNEMPLYSKDKMGANISILIIQFLFLLQTKKYADLIDRGDGLKTYAYRYVNKKETIRSYYFVKMLLEIPKAQFHKEAVIRKAEKHFSKLRNISPFDSKDAGSIEIIPYEKLWAMALDTLQSKHFHGRSSK